MSIALADGTVTAEERRNIRQTYGAQAARDLNQFQGMVARAVQPVGERSSRVSEREARRLTRTVGNSWLAGTASQLARSMRLGTTPALEARQPARRAERPRMAGQRDLGRTGAGLPMPSRQDYFQAVTTRRSLTGPVFSQGGRVAYGEAPQGEGVWVQSTPVAVPFVGPNEGRGTNAVQSYIRIDDAMGGGRRQRPARQQQSPRGQRQGQPPRRAPAPAPAPTFVNAPSRAITTAYRPGISTAYGQSSQAFGHEDLRAARNAGYSEQEIRSWLDANPGTLRGTNRPGQGGLYDELGR